MIFHVFLGTAQAVDHTRPFLSYSACTTRPGNEANSSEQFDTKLIG